MEERATFKFFRSYFEAAKDLGDKEMQADFLMAVCDYALNGKEPGLSGVPNALFRLVKPNLDKSNNLSENGKAGGKQTTSKPGADDKQTASKSEANSKQTPSKSQPEEGRRKKEEGSKEAGSTPHSPPAGGGFEEFWAAYPKKVGKQSAKKAFEKVKVSLETLVTAVERQKCSSQWSRDGGQYIPNAATWLNQGRWEDELPGGGGPDGPNSGDRKKTWDRQNYGIDL